MTTTVKPLPATVDAEQVRSAIELALRLGDPGAAWRATHALLRAFPDAVVPRVLLGQALLDAGNAPVAVDYFRRALRLNPFDAVAWGGLAGALARTGQQSAAAATLSRAVFHDPLGSEALAPGVADGPPLAGLGVVYLRRGHADLAVAELAVALERYPHRDDLRLYYIEALRRSGDLAAARHHGALVAPAYAERLPALLVRAALDDHAVTVRRRCAELDPDGRLTRRFFAPERPPWPIPPPPLVRWSEEFEPVGAYLPLASGQKAQALGSNHDAGEPALPIQKRAVGTPQATHGAGWQGENRQHASRPAPHDDAGARQRTTGDLPDHALKDFIAATEQVRHRLADIGAAPRPLVPWADGQAFTQVVLSSRAELQRRLGADGFAAVDRRLQQYAQALRRRGLAAHICYCDDEASLRLDDGIMAEPVRGDAGGLRDLVRTLSGALAEHGRELGAVLIVGGDEVVPFHRLPNPIPDDDVVVLSDNPYASDDPGYLVPQRIVARLPEGDGGDSSLLLAQLDRLTAYHYGSRPRTRASRSPISLPGLRQPHPIATMDTLSAGYCAEIWHETSRAVLDALAPAAPLRSSPPLHAANLDLRDLGGRRLLYMNLHGAAGLPNFYGQPDAVWPGAATRLPVALRPDQVDADLVDGALLLSEACYGVELAGRTARTSIPLRALASGALAVVGATVNAYGSLATPLIGADLLFQRMLAHLARGVPVGRALHQARIEFAQEMYRRQGFLDDVDIKTLIEFVLLGDPWGATHEPVAASRSWREERTIVAVERMPKPRPKAVLDETEAPREALRRARDILRRVLPGAAALPLRITAQINPRRQRKSDPERDLTFSARESRPTADGHYLAHAAHITISGEAVVKVAMTR
ncbi:MAG: tetratricopeptide repeat protein [Chloroflexi bacterium]|nr:tetratricopeptide repeat protein [Chloroflexota bacterium]